ncbi:MAG: ABC transporter ATP-binding protein [Candidatus Omnitrophica bacterium]|nr:ABC transporter ATP-binding protein [Candidatus Omnitrophota bacterium]
MFSTVNVHKTYYDVGQPVEVLRGVDLTICEKEFVALVGPSGAGKSTLLHILGGLDKPSKGYVLFNEKDIYELNDAKRSFLLNTEIGFVFQFYHLLPEFTALENIILPGLINQTFSNKKKLEKTGQTLLEKVGLGHRAHHKPAQLSGGEQQRVAIARCLINDPKIILCDEPTGNLDSKSGEKIMNLLLQLNQDFGQTVVMVTHDQSIAQRAKRVVCIQDGKLSI